MKNKLKNVFYLQNFDWEESDEKEGRSPKKSFNQNLLQDNSKIRICGSEIVKKNVTTQSTFDSPIFAITKFTKLERKL
jgi:hypothetical protein